MNNAKPELDSRHSEHRAGVETIHKPSWPESDRKIDKSENPLTRPTFRPTNSTTNNNNPTIILVPDYYPGIGGQRAGVKNELRTGQVETSVETREIRKSENPTKNPTHETCP